MYLCQDKLLSRFTSKEYLGKYFLNLSVYRTLKNTHFITIVIKPQKALPFLDVGMYSYSIINFFFHSAEIRNTLKKKTNRIQFKPVSFLFLYYNVFKVYLFVFERDRDSASRGGAEREGKRENPKQALHC